MGYLDQILHTLLFQHVSTTGLQNGDKGLQGSISANQGLLLKGLITLEPHGIFKSNFAYLYILISSRHRYPKRCLCFAKEECHTEHFFS